MIEKIKLLFLLILLSGQLQLIAQRQTKIDTAGVKAELAAIYERDQRPRTTGDSVQFISYIDSSNLFQVEAIIHTYGWPGKSFVGSAGNVTVFVVIQHADLKTQEQYFPLMKKSVKKNESRLSDLALLEDRILMRKGKKQKYGSQISINQTTGDPEIWPIEDEKNVNVRRAKAGLETMEEYATHFGIYYRLPK